MARLTKQKPESRENLKNTLIRQGKYADAVDDVLVKLTGAKRKKLKVVYI